MKIQIPYLSHSPFLQSSTLPNIPRPTSRKKQTNKPRGIQRQREGKSRGQPDSKVTQTPLPISILQHAFQRLLGSNPKNSVHQSPVIHGRSHQSCSSALSSTLVGTPKPFCNIYVLLLRLHRSSGSLTWGTGLRSGVRANGRAGGRTSGSGSWSCS